MIHRLAYILLILGASWLPSLAPAQSNNVSRAVEEEILEEVNLLRSRPEQYIAQVLQSLRGTAIRLPADAEKPFEAFRVFLSEASIDYIELDEGDTEDEALTIIDEAIREVTAAGVLPRLDRNAVLDKAARFFSRDRATRKQAGQPHIDSLGRGPAARIANLGLTEQALGNWEEFARGLPADRQVTIRVFPQDDSYFLVELPERGGYRYRYVSDAFGNFIQKHGKEATIPRIEKEGFEVRLELDLEQRRLQAEGDSIGYPLPLPTHGENVVWGAWSRKMAARGMVCWWVLDPGIEGRGHRRLLLDPDFKYCGIGAAWTRDIGWVATLDVTSEPLVAFPTRSAEQD